MTDDASETLPSPEPADPPAAADHPTPQQRVEAFLAEVRAAAERHGCMIVPTFQDIEVMMSRSGGEVLHAPLTWVARAIS